MDKLFAKIPFVDNVLKGVGQIMLQENRWTGLLFLVGLFLGSWQCGVAAILATAAGTFIAMKLNYDKSQINAGLYGFSAALVGVALAFIFQATILIWALIILGGALAGIIQHFFIQKNPGIYLSVYYHYLGIGIPITSVYSYSAIGSYQCRNCTYRL